MSETVRITYNIKCSSNVNLDHDLGEINKRGGKVYCKSLAIFFLLNRINNQKSASYFDIKLFKLPVKNKTLTFLRAPYRYKVGKLGIMFIRHNFMLSFKVKLLIRCFDVFDIIKVITTSCELGKSVDSNLARVNRVRIYTKCSLISNFIKIN